MIRHNLGHSSLPRGHISRGLAVDLFQRRSITKSCLKSFVDATVQWPFLFRNWPEIMRSFFSLSVNEIGFNWAAKKQTLFVCNRGDTVQYHSGLRSRELGQAPMLQVFLIPHQQMVWLYWLQDRDSMPNWYTINHPTKLHTTWNPVTHSCLPMSLCASGCILQAKLTSLDT